MSDIIVCKYCNREIGIKQMGRHLWKIHNQKYEDYVKHNLNDFLVYGWKPCSICGKISNKKTCSRECFKRHCSNIKRGTSFGPMSDITKQKLSDNRKEKYVNGWAPRVGKVHTEDAKQKISKANTGHQSFLGKHHSEETKQHLSKIRIESGIAKGEKNPMYGKTHTPEAIQKIFSHRKMNKLEKIVAEELDKNGIQYTFQFFIIENRICKSYDFKIKGRPIIIEVDGDFWHGNPNVKHHYENVDEVKTNDLMKDIIASERGYKVIRLWESDIKKDPSVILKVLT